MSYALPNFRRWILGGVVYVFAHVGALASQSITGGADSRLITVTVNSVTAAGSTSTEKSFDISYTVHMVGTDGGVVVAQFPVANSWSHFFSWSGATYAGGNAFYTPGTLDFTDTSHVTFPIAQTQFSVSVQALSSGTDSSEHTMYVQFPTGCGSKSYYWAMTNPNIFRRRFIILAIPDDSSQTPTVLTDVWLGYKGYQVSQGTLPNYCGHIEYRYYDEGDELGHQFTPPSSPPTPPPNPPPAPPAYPTDNGMPSTPPVTPPPDIPSPPGSVPTPTPSPLPGGLPAPDPSAAEEIKWLKDSNDVQRDTNAQERATNEALAKMSAQNGYANDRLKEISENTRKSSDIAGRGEAREKAIEEAAKTPGEMAARGEEAAREAAEAFGGVPSHPAPDFATDVPDFDMALGSHPNMVAHLNPFTEDRFGPFCAAFKKMVAWFLVLKFGIWALKAAHQTAVWILHAQQAKGNTVAGSGGQITAFLAAGLITAFVLTGITVIAAWKDTDVGGTSVTAAMGVNPMEDFSGKLLWCLDKLVPIRTIVAVMYARITFRWQCVVTAIIVKTATRFIVP